jgi:hypothetical protein
MSDDPEWFTSKRYGFGATPSSWQGWALLTGYVVLISITGLLIPSITWWGYASILVMLTAVFIMIIARKTRGGLRWRWGEEE